MNYIYANLLGKWTCLNDDKDCRMGPNLISPEKWWNENAEMWAPLHRKKANSLQYLPYVHVIFEGKQYRLSPCHLQIVRK
ncbi:hypothetical protein [Lactococcus garvieae]|uniref:Uncharacterized protein n=1 Tax=Lactococcus garvieae TaxID=1363 RepID=A0A1I4J7A9_9LACT|nr:hypothetical protein [Lactococcus garvieae]SFL62063.1 hypothetical protein SAMN05216438_1342 [Lactococcus garvieae]